MIQASNSYTVSGELQIQVEPHVSDVDGHSLELFMSPPSIFTSNNTRPPPSLLPVMLGLRASAVGHEWSVVALPALPHAIQQPVLSCQCSTPPRPNNAWCSGMWVAESSRSPLPAGSTRWQRLMSLCWSPHGVGQSSSSLCCLSDKNWLPCCAT